MFLDYAIKGLKNNGDIDASELPYTTDEEKAEKAEDVIDNLNMTEDEKESVLKHSVVDYKPEVTTLGKHLNGNRG